MLEYYNIDPETVDMLTRLFFAAVLGSIVGLERDVHGRNAGLRTHLLVCMGSALFMIMSELIASKARIATSGLAAVNADPARIAAQVVTGIGFIGAGAIIKSGLSVRGLTTAATLWVVASIGMAVGAGGYIIASVTTFFTVFSLVSLNYFERWYRKDSYRKIIVVTKGLISSDEITKCVNHKAIEIKSYQIERNYTDDTCSITLMLRVYVRGSSDKISAAVFQQLEESSIELKSIKWGR